MQFLPVELPAGVEFVGARVAGESVRVDTAAGSGGNAPLLVPLLKTRPGELSYDVELTYRRPARGPAGGRGPWFPRWRLDDPNLPGIPIEKTLWNVYLPDDDRVLSTGGNLEPVITALAETEKLESTLSDLRSLSATYGSARVNEQERRLALKNFTSLAGTVSQKAQTDFSGRKEDLPAPATVFRRLDSVGQNAVANQKQQSILREIGTLNTANTNFQQLQTVKSEKDSTVTLSGANTYTGQTTLGMPQWRDNRAVGFAGNLNAGSSINAGETPVAAVDAKTERSRLTLNDSLAVGQFEKKNPQQQLLMRDSLLGVDGDKDVSQFGFRSAQPQPADEINGGGVGGLLTPRPGAQPSSATSPDAPGAPPAPPMMEAAAQPETLRTVGRISLAVDFPLEGQVYHFKKVGTGARLTLWSTQPDRFVRLGWFAVLVIGTGVVWAARRVGRRVITRRRFARLASA